jgi:tetratricopeptide (TPR) repeat protein
MFRPGTLSLLAFALITFAAITVANPPDDADSRFNKALSVQTAMARARFLLSEKNTQKAVDVLEENLPKVNGNAEYLVLLRDAYRTHIRDLLLAGDAEQARRYLNRLCILDPSAANDPALRPAVETPPRKFEQDAAKGNQWPSFQKLLINPFTKKEEPKAPQADVFRGTAPSATVEDPFDSKNRRENPLANDKATVTRELLARGAVEFKNERYAEARVCFEQAYQTEASSLDVCREQWAYCILKSVEEAMAQPGTLPGRLTELQNQVDGAIKMAPTKMLATGQQLHAQLEQRAKQPVVSVTKVNHRGANAEGWQVAETPHFRIFHKQNNDYAERVAQIADKTRLTMYRKWFGHDGGEWQPICELILHPNAAAYTQMTGVPGNSPGHSRIESDPSGRVIARRMDMRMDANGMMDAVLPHETTHVVLAGMFGVNHVPRWCDEGIAVLSEPNEKIDMHRRNLLKHHADGQLFGLKELMELNDYPQPRRIGAFYAQSVVLTEFLTQQKGPRVVTEFIKDGLRYGYDQALQKHYGMTFAQLEQLWQQQVLSNPARFAAQK